MDLSADELLQPIPFPRMSDLFHYFCKVGTPNAQPLSFPTRRSSDLEPAGELGQHAHQPDRLPGAGETIRLRSEEHTSELQSPYELVCRLLPEKKNSQEILEFSTAGSHTFA